MDEKTVALIFKAFCDENRIRIIKMLRNGEKCACKLLEELNVTQPTLSHHMKILCDSGIVAGRKEGKWMHYSISAQGAKAAADILKELTAVRNGCENKSCCLFFTDTNTKEMNLKSWLVNSDKRTNLKHVALET